MGNVPEIKCGHKKLSILKFAHWKRGGGKPFTVITYQCRSCGFVFQDEVDGKLYFCDLKIRNAQLSKKGK